MPFIANPVIFGGAEVELANAITYSTNSNSVYVTGAFSSTAIGINGANTLVNTDSGLSTDTFVLALDANTLAVVSGFGTQGFQKFGGSGFDEGVAITASASAVYVAGRFISVDAGIGGAGTTLYSGGGTDAFVIALNPATGAALPGFGTAGVQTIAGHGEDQALGVAVSGNTLFVTGDFTGGDLGIGGVGSIASLGLTDGFVASLNASSGAAIPAFGTTGITRFGGSNSDSCSAIAVSGPLVFVAGSSSSTDIPIGGVTGSSAGLRDAFVLALDFNTSAPSTTFGNAHGAVFFGGSDDDQGAAIGAFGTAVYVAGTNASLNAGINGPGKFNGKDFLGFLLPLDRLSGSPVFPAITSPLAVLGTVNQPFSYTITSNPAFTSSSAVALPPGLSFDAPTGVISGTPTLALTFQIPISVTVSGADGTTSAILMIAIVDDRIANMYPPVITGGDTAVALDAAGNRYVCGQFTDARDFNPMPGIDAHMSAGQQDVFVTRFNADGSYAWTQTFGGSDTDVVFGVAVDNGTVYVGGSFKSSDAGIGGPGNYKTLGNFDAFVMALNATTGNAVPGFGVGGVQIIGGMLDDNCFAIAAAGGVVYGTGSFSSHDAGIGGLGAVNNAGDSNAFVFALNGTTGAPKTAFGSGGIQTFGGNAVDSGNGLIVANGAIYITGYLSSLNGGIGGTGTNNPAGGTDIFVVALDPVNGTALPGFGNAGVALYGGVQNEFGNGIAFGNGGLFVAGVAFDATSLGSGIVVKFDAATGAIVPGFGTGGVQTFGGTGDDLAIAVATLNNAVYVAGNYTGDAALGGGTMVSSASGTQDAYILALDQTTGLGLSGFGTGGVQTFGGSAFDGAAAIAAGNGSVFVAGEFFSTDAGTAGTGLFDAARFNGYLLKLDAATGSAAPVITGTLTASGNSGATFSYTITASNNPLSFTASPLPSGLALVGDTISGILPAADTYNITLTATNGFGTSPDATLVLIVAPTGPPNLPAIDVLDSTQNPVKLGDAVTITLSASESGVTSLQYDIDFGDGTPHISGNIASGVPMDFPHSYTAEGGFTVLVTVTDGANMDMKSYTQSVVAPASGGEGIPNISDGTVTQTVTNPVDNLIINVQSSEGGVITLDIDASVLHLRAPVIIQTDWGDVAGRTSTTIGSHPVHQYRQRGVFVATVRAKDKATGMTMGMGRKTLVLSAKETGQLTATPLNERVKVPPPQGPLLDNSDDTTITLKAFSGKFLFTATKNDTCAFTGTFKLPVGFNPAQLHDFSIGMGNITYDAMVNEKGVGKALGSIGLKKLKLTYKVKKGKVATGIETAQIAATFTVPGMVNNGFDTEGVSPRSTDLDAKKRSAARNIQVGFQLDGAAFEAPIPVTLVVSKKSDFGTVSGRRSVVH